MHPLHAPEGLVLTPAGSGHDEAEMALDVTCGLNVVHGRQEPPVAQGEDVNGAEEDAVALRGGGASRRPRQCHWLVWAVGAATTGGALLLGLRHGRRAE